MNDEMAFLVDEQMAGVKDGWWDGDGDGSRVYLLDGVSSSVASTMNVHWCLILAMFLAKWSS